MSRAIALGILLASSLWAAGCDRGVFLAEAFDFESPEAFEKAVSDAHNGDAEAAMRLAEYYTLGFGDDLEEGRKWTRMAANGGLERARVQWVQELESSDCEAAKIELASLRAVAKEPATLEFLRTHPSVECQTD